MKRNFLLMLSFFMGFSLNATVVWNGTSTPDAINENLTIEGDDCWLQNGTTFIVAENCDVTVTVSSNAVVHAQPEAQYIEVIAFWPYTVTFKVDHDLKFVGIDGMPTEPLYIYVEGDGTIRWEVDDDSKLKFYNQENSGPTRLWQWYGSFEGPSSTPKHIFKVKKQHSVIIGRGSSIGFSVEGCSEWSAESLVESDDFDSSGYPYINMHHESKFLLELIID